MNERFLKATFLAVVMAAVSLPALAGQAPAAAGKANPGAKQAPAGKAWTAPRTPWGDPDLQGVWNDATSTPLQRQGGVG